MYRSIARVERVLSETRLLVDFSIEMADPVTMAPAEEEESADKSEWEGIIMEAIATMIYVFVCCGVVASTANVTFDELNSPRLVVISLARELENK